MTEVYDQELKIRNKTIKFRKWKVKDKKKYLDNIKDISTSREALIYDCIEDKKIVFDEEELKYVLVKIRTASIKDAMNYKFICDNCNEPYEYSADLNNIMVLKGTGHGEIEVQDTTFEMGYPTNKDFYQQMIFGASSIEARELIDFMLHVKSLNDDNTFTFEELNDYISNMDIDKFEMIMNKWRNMQVHVDNVSSVTCPHCNTVEWYEFDALPGFFPPSWSIE